MAVVVAACLAATVATGESVAGHQRAAPALSRLPTAAAAAAAAAPPSSGAAHLLRPATPTRSDCGNEPTPTSPHPRPPPSPPPAPARPAPPPPPPVPGHADPRSQVIVACGSNLTGASVSDLAVGACVARRTSSDPRVFGPDAWRTLHRFAANYPDEPTPATARACAAFVTSLPLMLPCSRCGADFAQFVRDNARHAGSFHPSCRPQPQWGGKCTDVATTCSSRAHLVSFFLRAHDNVNRWTNGCREPWSPARAAEAYGVAHDFCAGSIVVGDNALCRWIGDDDCVEPHVVDPDVEEPHAPA